jgi:hypothetical protein
LPIYVIVCQLVPNLFAVEKASRSPTSVDVSRVARLPVEPSVPSAVRSATRHKKIGSNSGNPS